MKRAQFLWSEDDDRRSATLIGPRSIWVHPMAVDTALTDLHGAQCSRVDAIGCHDGVVIGGIVAHDFATREHDAEGTQKQNAFHDESPKNV